MDCRIKGLGKTRARSPPSAPALTTADDWRMWSAITCPTLLARDAAERMAVSHPHCTLVEIAGAGHSAPMDRPMEFEPSAREWLGV